MSAVTDVNEGINRAWRHGQLSLSADDMEIVHGGPISAKQEMVTVVYEAFQRGFEQGAASSASMIRGFIERGPVSGLGQLYGGRQASKAGADDMNAAFFGVVGCHGYGDGGHGIKKTRSAG